MQLIHGVTFAEVQSFLVNEDGDALSLWLTLSDGSTCAIHLDIADLIAAGYCIEEATHAPANMVLQ